MATLVDERVAGIFSVAVSQRGLSTSVRIVLYRITDLIRSLLSIACPTQEGLKQSTLKLL